jgi:hypothetical protein
VALEYAIRKARECQKREDLYGKLHHLVFDWAETDGNICSSAYQNEGQNCNIDAANKLEYMKCRKSLLPFSKGWEKYHNQELNNLYSSTNIITVIEPIRMRLVGHGGNEKCVQNFVKKREERRPLGGT